MFVLLLFFFVVALFLARQCIDYRKYADFYKIKGPKPLPLLGNALLFGINPKPADVFSTQQKLANEFGEIYRMSMGPERIICISNPEQIELILGSTKHIKKSQHNNMFLNWLLNGLINSNGAFWRKHRKIITPTFHFKSMHDYATFMEKHVQRLVDILKTKLAKQNNSKLININHFVNSAMRYNLNAQSGEQHPYVHAIKRYLVIHMTRIFSLLLRAPLFFKNSQLGREQSTHAECMKSFTNEVINSRKAERVTHRNLTTTSENELDEHPRRSFLDLLLYKQDEEQLLNDAEIRDEVNTFMFAGHDTVSSSISFCLYELAQHLVVQDALVEESLGVMPAGKQIEVDCANIGVLKYLDRVVKECMRIYTTVPYIGREIEEELTIDGKRIPGGTTVRMMIYTLHHNPKYFPDPEKIDPERFNTENSRNRHAYAYIPFSAGPRNCIGYKYGQLLTKATVINILRNYKISRSTDPQHKLILYNSGILESVNGIHLHLEERL